jgi:hypothetical protein
MGARQGRQPAHCKRHDSGRTLVLGARLCTQAGYRQESRYPVGRPSMREAVRQGRAGSVRVPVGVASPPGRGAQARATQRAVAACPGSLAGRALKHAAIVSQSQTGRVVASGQRAARAALPARSACAAPPWPRSQRPRPFASVRVQHSWQPIGRPELLAATPARCLPAQEDHRSQGDVTRHPAPSAFGRGIRVPGAGVAQQSIE